MPEKAYCFGMRTEAKSDVAVVILPLPLHGHLNPLLQLSTHIAGRHGIDVYYVTSASLNRRTRLRINPSHLPSTHLHFHDLPFPSSITFDHAAVTAHLLPHLSSLLLSLSPCYRRVALVHDSSMSFATSAADLIPNAEPFAFHPASAISNLFFQWDTYGTKPDDDRLFRYDLDDCFGVGFLDFIRRQRPMTSVDSGRVINTCRAVEGEFLDRLAWKGQRVFAVGPLNPIITAGGRENHAALSWLDCQPPESVVYVSFGTTSTMSKEQMRELAAGLEASMRRFLWVIRKADYIEDDEQVDDAHLHGFDFEDFSKRVRGRGKMVRGWAPQLEILSHPATGAFISHCGWNSCMEAMSSGVPILTWPIQFDQPANAVLVTEVLRAGIVAREWEKKDEVATGERIAAAIERLMGDGHEGREVRSKAREVGDRLRAAVAEGGTAREELDALVAYISRP